MIYLIWYLVIPLVFCLLIELNYEYNIIDLEFLYEMAITFGDFDSSKFIGYIFWPFSIIYFLFIGLLRLFALLCILAYKGITYIIDKCINK